VQGGRERFDQHGCVVGHVRWHRQARIDRRQEPRAEAPGQVVDAERAASRAMRRQAAPAERAGVGEAARVVRGVDLDDVPAATFVERQHFVADHLRQRERQMVAREIGRADAALRAYAAAGSPGRARASARRCATR
jgi:hypothetical protein